VEILSVSNQSDDHEQAGGSMPREKRKWVIENDLHASR
jgi:hypothetical protein